MSKKANVKPNQRQKIVDRRKDGKSYGQIAKALKLSKTACLQAMKYVKANGICENKKRTRQRKTTEREDRRIHRLSEENRHKTAVDIHSELAQELTKPISVRTVKRRLNEFGLMGRIARKKPFISKKNQKERLKWAKEHVDWSQEQWSKVTI